MNDFAEETIARLTTLFATVAELGEMTIRDLLTPGKYDQYQATLDAAYDALVHVEDALDGLGVQLEYQHWRISSAFEELKPLLIQPRTLLDTFEQHGERQQGGLHQP